MASEFTIGLEYQNGNTFWPPADLEFVPKWYSATAIGGPELCQVDVYGPINSLWRVQYWLAYRLYIYSRNGDVVWWGELTEVDISLGNLQIGRSLKSIANKVAVAYTEQDADGSSVRATTSWSSDTDSVNTYGTHEHLETLAEGSQDIAEARRDTILANRAYPPVTVRTESGQSVSATLYGTGWWQTLDYTYYQNLSGIEEHVDGGASQVLGAGTTGATNTGFNGVTSRIFNVGTALLPESKFIIASSSSNNGTFTVANLVEQDDATVTQTTISFAVSDDIYDTGANLDAFRTDDIIQVQGTTSNDGIYRVKTANKIGGSHPGDDPGEHIEVDTFDDAITIAAEAAGSSFTLRRRSYVQTEEALTEEDASASLSITAWGQYIYQTFTLTENTYNWTVDKIAIQIKSVGTPSDNVRVGLHLDSSGSPGTELDYGTLAGSAISDGLGWVEFALNNTDQLAYGTTYGIKISRDGSISLIDYYVVTVDEDLGYTLGALKLYDGSSLQTRWNDADLLFRVLGAEETTSQIENALSGHEFIDSVDIIDDSGVYSNQYRDGDSTVLDEVVPLLNVGTSAGARMLAKVTKERALLVEAQVSRASGANEIFYTPDGWLRDAFGKQYPHGRLPSGKWITLDDIPGAVGLMTDVSPFFCERVEFDVESGTYRLEAPDQNIWDVGVTQQG